MAAETKIITVWQNDHAEFVKLCTNRGWLQPAMFHEILAAFIEAQRDQELRPGR